MLTPKFSTAQKWKLHIKQKEKLRIKGSSIERFYWFYTEFRKRAFLLSLSVSSNPTCILCARTGCPRQNCNKDEAGKCALGQLWYLLVCGGERWWIQANPDSWIQLTERTGDPKRGSTTGPIVRTGIKRKEKKRKKKRFTGGFFYWFFFPFFLSFLVHLWSS